MRSLPGLDPGCPVPAPRTRSHHSTDCTAPRLHYHAEEPACPATYTLQWGIEGALLLWCPLRLPCTGGQERFTQGVKNTNLCARTPSLLSRACMNLPASSSLFSSLQAGVTLLFVPQTRYKLLWVRVLLAKLYSHASLIFPRLHATTSPEGFLWPWSHSQSLRVSWVPPPVFLLYVLSLVFYS